VHLDQVAANMIFSEITADNFDIVGKIYGEGIKTGLATFESQVPSWEKWDQSHLEFGRITLEKEGQILGWAALSSVSDRCVYGGVAEVSVYVAATARGRGVGEKLLNQLVLESEENGIWTLQSGIMTENYGSIRLHEKCGFRKIGYREKVARLDGEWKDNTLMERRSKKVGI